jgi:hypothetical protein
MAIPQEVEGSILDALRPLAFRNDVTVEKLNLYNERGNLLIQIDHFWKVERPRKRFGQNFETITFTIIEDATNLSTIMRQVRTLRYVSADEAQVETLSEPHICDKIPEPPLGRNRKWVIDTTLQTAVSEFYTAPGT